MELELKHLAPYLPYQIRLYYDYSNKIGYLRGLYNYPNESHPYRVVMDWGDSGHIWMFKPILRPVSDLTKEIEHDGEKFIPMDVLFGMSADEEKAFEVYGELPAYWDICLAVDIGSDWEYYAVSRLFEWHFDVFGLIDEKLAININEL